MRPRARLRSGLPSERPGLPGGSSTSVTFTVTAMVSSTEASALPLESRPSLTPTVTP